MWQLIENLARTDLQPGELAAAMIFERCAILIAKLEEKGVAVPPSLLGIADPTQKWTSLNKFKDGAGYMQISAPWTEVIHRLGLRLSEDKVVQLARAFSQMTPELAEEMDAAQIRLSSRLSYLKLAKNHKDAADELWEAVKATGKPHLFTGAVRETLEHPNIDPERALERAEEIEIQGNEARAAALRKPDETEEVAAEVKIVDIHLLDATVNTLSKLVTELRSGAVMGAYDAGSLRLYIDELISFLPAPKLARVKRTA
jgi:ParB family chromosome partitioning protein